MNKGNEIKADVLNQVFNAVKSVSTGMKTSVVDMGNESFQIGSTNVNNSVEQLESSIKNTLTQLAAGNESIRHSLDGNKMAILEETVKNTYLNLYNPKRFVEHIDRLMGQNPVIGENSSHVAAESSNFSNTFITNNELKNYVLNNMATGNEAWDGETFDTTLTYNVVLNYTATEQDELAKALFPIIPIKTTDGFFEITSNSIYVMNQEPTHDINGRPSSRQFERKSVIKSALDPDTWMTDRNLLVPVVRTESEDMFLTEYKTLNSRSGVTVTTAPLKIDKDIGLIGISHDDQLAAKGAPDYTDTVDRDLQLDDIYIEITSKDGTKKSVFKYNVYGDPLSRFLPSPQGEHEKELIMNYKTKGLYLDIGTSKDASNQPAEVLESLANTFPNYKLQLSVAANGTIITSQGDINVSQTGSGSIVGLYDEKGNLIPYDDNKYEQLKNMIGNIKIIGYTLVAYRTNSNLRVNGKLLTSDISKRTYTVPFHTAVTVSGPVSNIWGTENDINRLAGNLSIGNLAIRHDAVYQLQKHAATLRRITEGTVGNMRPSMNSLAENFVDVYYKYDTLNLTTMVDSLSSSNRLKDIRSALLNRIFDNVAVMGNDSGYYNALSSFFPGSNSELHVVLATDPIIGAYLRGGGDGDDLKFDKDKFLEIVVSPNKSMRGKIYVTFTVYKTFEGGKHMPHPLAFGWCPWAPATVIDITRSVNNAVRRDLFNIMRYANITNLPIMLEYDVTGLDAVLGKIEVYTREIGNGAAALPGPGGANTVNAAAAKANVNANAGGNAGNAGKTTK